VCQLLLAHVLWCGNSVATAETPPNTLTAAEQKGGWRLLFDGQTTEGWRNYKQDSVSDGWQVTDGALQWTRPRAGDLISEQKFDRFELSLDYKISPGGNSGVMFHVAETNGPPWHTGPEIQVQDNVDGHDPQKAGWLYQLFQPDKMGDQIVDATRPAGEWNQLYIRINGDDCEVCMNGVRYYRFRLGDEKWNERVAKSKFARMKRFGREGEGHICLQDHGNQVAYRNIKIREFDEDGTVPQPIDGKLNLKSSLAFPQLNWDGWEAVDDAGKIQPLRLIELTHANDGSNRLYAASQRGQIWTFENDPQVEQSHLFLDLQDKVVAWAGPGANEEGLLGLAFHPDFKSNGQFFVYYSRTQEQKSYLSRFTVSQQNPLKADPDSETVLMEIDQPFQNHNGGSIEFGPDGFLYIGLGDGGWRNDPHENGQDLSTLLGSILRIDVDHPADGKLYGIPSDNPFVGHADARPEIYAFGLRNPWRIAFDKQTGLLWTGDVGQELWEEIDLITKGGNYGWNIREGTHPFGNSTTTHDVGKMIEPVWEYDHQIGKSITGGRVYRSDRVSQLSGKYLYADYVTGGVWALSVDPSGTATRNEQVFPDSVPVLAFGEDATGEVYFLTSSAKGECIYRFESP
jgi:glucose/arabinose dehydrogenase